MRRQLDQESELSLDGKEVYVRDGRGRSITIDQRIGQLKPLYGFPPNPTKPAPLRIPKNDMQKLSENLNKLADGTAVAERTRPMSEWPLKR